MSSGPQLIVTMSSDEAKLWRGLQNIIDQEKKVETGAEGITAAARRAERELARFAEKTKQIDTSPAERMRAEINKLDAALKKGLLTQEQFNKAKARVIVTDARSQKVDPNIAKQREELKKFAEQTKRIDATPVMRYQAEIKKLDAALKKGLITQAEYATAVKRTNEQFTKSGKAPLQEQQNELEGVFTKVKGVAATWLSIQGGIAAANHLLEEHQQLLDRGKAETRDKDPGRRGLAQVAETPEDILAANRRADQLAVKYGVDRKDVRELMLEANNYGIAGTSGFLEKAVAAENILKPTEVVRAGGTLSGIYDKKYSPEQAANATLKASQKSVLNFEDFAPALQSAATSAKTQGADLDEVAAIMGVLPEVLGKERAATRTSRFAAEMTKHDEFRGKGVLSAVESLQKMSRDEREGYLGESIEVHEGYEAISANLQRIRNLQPEIKAAIAGTGGDRDIMVEQSRKAAEADDLEGGKHRALMQANAAKQAADIAVEQRYSKSGLIREQVSELNTKVLAQNNHGMVAKSIVGSGQWMFNLMGDEMAQRAAAGTSVSERAKSEGRGLLAANADAYRMMFAPMEEVVKELERASRELANTAAENRRAAGANASRVQRQGTAVGEGS
jgi:hypothetical protein